MIGCLMWVAGHSHIYSMCAVWIVYIVDNDKAAASLLYPRIKTTNDTLSEMELFQWTNILSGTKENNKFLKSFFRQVN